MRANPSKTRFLLLLGASLLAMDAPAALAGPEGGTVARGKASISRGDGRTVVRQSSNRAVIDWTAFDVGRDDRVVFDQPGRGSATLNRIGSARPSVIEGAIEARGTVVLQNRAGVTFTETSRIDAGGLVATSGRVDPERFARGGGLRIGGGGRPGARIANRGEITVRAAGLAALVGGDVENAGSIVADRGTVVLSSGARTTLDFAGDGMIRFAAQGDGGGVSNSGLLDAGGGRVVLSAGSAARALDSAINTTGVIRATSEGEGGRIEILGRGDGAVRIGGVLDASGGRRGGSVSATGAAVEIGSGARIAAGGAAAGGRVRLGGGARGEGPLRRADHLRLDAGARVDADGGRGRGGEVVLWSEGVTRVDGAVSATGAEKGGFVETSGRFALDVGRTASVSVGEGGEWLLDPRDIVIGTGGAAPGLAPPGSGAHRVNRVAVMAALNGGADVTVTTRQPDASGAGDITVSGPISWNGTGRLRLEAERDIRIEAPMNPGDGDFVAMAARDIVAESPITAPQDGGVTLDAGRGIKVNHNLRAPGSGDIDLVARTGDISVSEARTGNVVVSTSTGALSLEAARGSVLLRRANPEAGANVQVFSDSGPVAVSAGDRIFLQGGAQGGRWVRLGRAGSSADVSLRASEIEIWGGDAGNTFAEVVSGPGGSITMDASRIRVANGRGDQGRVQTLGGSPLTLRAAAQTWDGPVRAGSGARDGGEVVVAGAVRAGFQPQLSLAPGAGFTLLPSVPDGAASRYDSSQPFVVTTSGTGTVEIGAPVAAQEITLESQERVGLGPAGRLIGAAPGDAVTVAAGRRFRNDSAAGPAALTAADPDGRWTLYLDAFDGLAGPAPAPRAFDLYGRAYADTPPSALGFDGNRIVYAERPTLTLTADSLAKTYGQAAVPGFAAAGLRPGDTLDVALVAPPDVASAGAAPDAPVRATPHATTVVAEASAQGYLLDLVPGALTVAPAPLTVSADPQSRVYGADGPRLSATVEGFVLGEDLSDLGGALALVTTAGPRSGVGTYAISASGLTGANYAITYADAALTVTPAPLTVTVDAASRAYGAENPRLTATIEGFVLGEDPDDLDGALTLTTAATRGSGVGTYAVAASGLTGANYAITVADAEDALTITPAPLTVTPDSKTRAYGAENPALTATIEGFVLGEGLSDLDGDLSLATTATRRSGVGTYAIDAGGLTGANYAIAYAEGALTVAPARLTVTPDAQTRTYGAQNPRLTAAIDGFVLGEDADDLDGALSLTTAATRRSGVGTYAIAAAGLSGANYAVTYAEAPLTVTPAPLTVTADAKTRTYGGRDPRLTASIDGFVLGEGPADLGGALTLDTAAERGSGVGTYAVTAGGLASANYAISYAEGALTVTPAPLTVSAEPKTRAYGAGNPRLTANVAGFVLGEDVDDLEGALTLTTPADRRSGVGTYAITAGGLASPNYAIAYADGALTVTPAPLTVSADPKSRRYGDENPRLTATLEGFVLGEDADDLGGDLRLSTSATRRSGVGAYAIAASGLSSPNYAITYADGALTVAPAPLTVTPDPQTRTYGAENPRLTAGVEGFVLDEGLSDLDGVLALSTPATRRSGVGTYVVRAGGLSSDNYAIAYADGALAVTPAPLTVRADDAARTYGAGTPRLTATIEGFVLDDDATDLTGALALSTSATRRSGVGTYAVTAGGLASANYAITYADGALAVTPARLTVAANDAARPEGAANPAFTARIRGFVLGEDRGALDGTLRFVTDATPFSPAGSYALVPGGLASPNYAIDYAGGRLTVTPSAALQPPRQGVRAGFEIVGRGAAPFTPGDAAFRTTPAEAPPALAGTFELIYSLGDIPQLTASDTGGFVPAAGASDTGGFVPAAGGAEAAEPCAPSAWAGSAADCAPAGAESFWSTTFPEAAR